MPSLFCQNFLFSHTRLTSSPTSFSSSILSVNVSHLIHVLSGANFSHITRMKPSFFSPLSRFLFEGQVIRPEATPEELGMCVRIFLRLELT
jgi:hypothetical protein